ncbi:hypothetical protein GCM10022223_18950 [Kineosporia mesophila]|uniref:DUF2892 domain-containing protein n=1 Tax=Kineosporia mesophila TaxID=566012 RepID=A0ABP6ZEC9_9ACTN
MTGQGSSVQAALRVVSIVMGLSMLWIGFDTDRDGVRLLLFIAGGAALLDGVIRLGL